MGWGAVWQLASQQFGAEPVEIRILVIVGLAFAVLMILIGLKHAFRASGPVADPKPEPILPRPVFAVPAPVAAAAVEPLPGKPAVQPFRAVKPMRRATRKCAKRTINHQQTLRPQIRRAAMTKLGEIDAPFSPLPPRG